MPVRTRFAPSPTGLLHIGNAYSALYCLQWAEQHQASCLLRIEDIDHTRCRSKYVEAMLEDLAWLGMQWPEEPLLQSERLPLYRQTLDRLRRMQVIYPCFCTRRDIQEEIRRMATAPHRDDPPPHYPGTCRRLPPDERQWKMARQPFAWRLDTNRALAMVGEPLCWHDEQGRTHALQLEHDIVIARRDIGISYHLATVIDDAEQRITHIIRGEDLRDSLAIHRLLQCLLGLPEPVYIHHRLVRDAAGRRLAKRHAGTTLRSLRDMGISAGALRHFLLNSPDLIWPAERADAERIRHLLGNVR